MGKSEGRGVCTEQMGMKMGGWDILPGPPFAATFRHSLPLSPRDKQRQTKGAAMDGLTQQGGHPDLKTLSGPRSVEDDRRRPLAATWDRPDWETVPHVMRDSGETGPPQRATAPPFEVSQSRRRLTEPLATPGTSHR